MADSPFFARIRGDVLAIVGATPPGRVATFADIGGHIDVMPRHIAYILRMLGPIEQDVVPWHRAVSADGSLLAARAAEQAAKLAAEGIAVGGGRIVDLDAHRIAIDTLPHGIAPRLRPADAPIPKSRKRR